MAHHDLWHDDRIKEECGVVGLWVPGEDIARLAFFSLFALQHRGQESCGLAVSDGHQVRMYKEMGLVSQVFNEDILKTMPGETGIGHTRYSTAGPSEHRNAQPISCTSVVGQIAVAHNGNLINDKEIRAELEAQGHVFSTSADSEVIARLLVEHLPDGIEAAVKVVMERVLGAYSVTVLTPTALFGFRDPHGVRPLVVGKLRDGYMMASETCAFEPVGARVERDLEPGEVAIVEQGELRYTQAVPTQQTALCLFETIYFARPDSVMYGTSLYKARERMGMRLAIEHPAEADLVVPVPDSGIPAAIGYSKQSGIPFEEAMVKSRYIHRTFIQPDQKMRELGVRMKLSPLRENIAGKRLVLVDDSIVRGTTTDQIVQMLYDSGATEVHVRITAPPIVYPCFYGIDMAKKDKLIAAVMSIEEIRQKLGATSLGYLSVEGAQDAVGQDERRFCTACFTGRYPVPIPPRLQDEAFADPRSTDTGELATVASGQLLLPVE